MLKIFANALSAVKDRAIEASAKALINQKIQVIGRVAELQIDSKQKTISAQMVLQGETAPPPSISVLTSWFRRMELPAFHLRVSLPPENGSAPS
jgi:sporulation protein YlmC with PRC-barrel domain